jgi:magnesium chelatase subunit D
VGLTDALTALRLLRADPGLGGLWLRDPDGRMTDQVIAAARRAWAMVRTVPVAIDAEALLGGIDISASLRAGRAVRSRGLLAEAAGSLLVIRGAERMSPATGAILASGLERGGFALLLIDEGGGEETPPAALVERLAFCVRGDAGQTGSVENNSVGDDEISSEDQIIQALAGAAAMLGVGSARATLLALRAARAACASDGRTALTHADAALAVALVLAPRATRLPAADDEPAPEPDPAPEPTARERLDDIVIEAARAALPADLMERLTKQRRRGPAPKARGAGERRRSRGGARLALLDTIRAAAPWQALRGADRTSGGTIMLQREDLRVRRFEDRAEALTIFAVDASGSSAAARLAEAKGAVELLLGRAYAKRSEVALVAFRGTSAELLLPPTRSLTRARRLLAELPGGGGTPLAAGLDAARALAEAARRRGRTPYLMLLTDGRANIGSDGTPGRAGAEADAVRSARRIGAAGFGGAVIDIGRRAEPDAVRIAEALGMPCLHLPRADAAALGAVLA